MTKQVAKPTVSSTTCPLPTPDLLVEAGVVEEVEEAVCSAVVIVDFSVGSGLLLPTTVASSYAQSLATAEA
jgi:hypothetical protein